MLGIDDCTVLHGGIRTSGVMVTCIKCGAVAREYVSPHSKIANGEDTRYRRAMRKFEGHGWSFVGKGPRCSSCIREGRAAQMRYLHALKGDTEMNSDKLNQLGMIPLGGLGPGGRVMDRSDRRVIFNKIDENYTDEKSGYKVGWTDQKIATDLGVPLAWVKGIREENFGPVSSNPEIDLVLAEAKKWKEEEGILNRKTETLLEQMAKHTAEVSKIMEELKKHTDKGEMVERKMFQIAKAVRP
jgi:hypothetical protein